MGDVDTTNPITYFAQTNFRNQNRKFGIKRRDRRSHIYIIGKTGVGKSTLIEALVRQDIQNGEGLALVDPHSDLVEAVLAGLPKSRESEVVYFNAANPLGFNPLQSVAQDRRPLAASGLLDVFKKLWSESWGPRLEHILRNVILALLDQPEATLADVQRLLTDPDYRRKAAINITNRQVYDFWLKEYEGYPARLRAEAIAPIQNKVGAFLANPLLQQMCAQSKSAFDLRQIMDQGKIFLVNLAKGRVGEDTAALAGALLVSQTGLTGLSRSDIPETRRRDFNLYLDEFPMYATRSLIGMLSELRKYRLNLVLAHQFLSQLDIEVRDSIIGNVGTLIAFRIGPADAETLAEEFFPNVSANDLVNLPNYSFYTKLMIDGAVSKPFSAETLKGA